MKLLLVSCPSPAPPLPDPSRTPPGHRAVAPHGRPGVRRESYDRGGPCQTNPGAARLARSRRSMRPMTVRRWQQNTWFPYTGRHQEHEVNQRAHKLLARARSALEPVAASRTVV